MSCGCADGGLRRQGFSRNGIILMNSIAYWRLQFQNREIPYRWIRPIHSFWEGTLYGFRRCPTTSAAPDAGAGKGSFHCAGPDPIIWSWRPRLIWTRCLIRPRSGNKAKPRLLSRVAGALELSLGRRPWTDWVWRAMNHGAEIKILPPLRGSFALEQSPRPSAVASL